ncbi:hypothetical protein Lalb_Chr14g0367471 [Lupinus albus]|uniref:FRIGIDA-like protein n=1 Tax=Lupinus albus TaxID=3870 RepID=A0A6A4PEL4_LUPAL|nr:hypothetical protein Lalb_Chr14g0367471 [Lupinus albus]
MESKEEKFEGRMKELESKENHLEVQVNEISSKEKQIEGKAKKLKCKKKHYEVQVKELESKKREFGGGLKDIDSKRIQILGQLKLLELQGKQCETLIMRGNLIKKQKHIEAVGFICAYKLIENYEPIDLLREQVQNARLICENSCKETKSFEIKVKAIDQEIVNLDSVLQCISDNNIKFHDLHMEIQDRILELQSEANNSICTSIRSASKNATILCEETSLHRAHL